ncbi:YeaC family protein [Pantoea sp. FN0302]|uniref:YeaC family protein n=1 Tax=unclassified Pantoea TaxID=2630326 RepID=UPI003CE6F059
MKSELKAIVEAMTPEIYQRLATAVEIGKWPDGVALTEEQKEHCMQLVMLWQAQHNHQPQHMSIGAGGELVTRSKRELKEEFGISDSVTRITLQ